MAHLVSRDRVWPRGGGGMRRSPHATAFAAAVSVKEVIHSGHFMVSDFERSSEDEQVDSLNVPILADDGCAGGVVADTSGDCGAIVATAGQADVKPTTIATTVIVRPSDVCVDSLTLLNMSTSDGRVNSSFATRRISSPTSASQCVAIDQSLTKLFHALTIAYNQQISNPRWNMFKGMRLNMKDKIRLNNVIWRCWHIQFIKRRVAGVCRFASAADDERKPLAVVLEGKYWKRKPEAVTAEYKKWRTYGKRRANVEHQQRCCIRTAIDKRLLSGTGAKNNNISLEMHAAPCGGIANCKLQAPMATLQANAATAAVSIANDHIDGDDLLLGDDSLMELLLQQPFAFPDPREMARVGVADLIQPGLLELQPGLGDMEWMDSMEPLPGWINSRMAPLDEEPLPPPPPPPPPPPRAEPAEPLAPPREPPTPLTLTSSSSACVELADDGHIELKPTLPLPPAESLQPSSSTLLADAPSTAVSGVYLTSVAASPHRSSLASSLTLPLSTSTAASSTAAIRAAAAAAACTATAGVQFILPAPSVRRPSLASSSSAAAAVSVLRRNSLTDVQLARASGAMERSISDSTCVRSAVRRWAATSSSTASATAATVRPSRQPPPPPPPPQRSTVLTQLLTSGVTSPAPAHAVRQIAGGGGGGGGGGGDSARRVCHTTSEQKRRGTIRGGFERLRALLPLSATSMIVSSSSSAAVMHGERHASKASKAALLHRGAAFIRELRAERTRLQEDTSAVRRDIDTLNQQIGQCQSLLPDTGAPVTNARQNKMRAMFDEHVRESTLHNWRYYLFAQLVNPLADSYAAAVSTSSRCELRRSVLAWQESCCALVRLRPYATQALCRLSRGTSVLCQPTRLPAEAVSAVCRLSPPTSASAVQTSAAAAAAAALVASDASQRWADSKEQMDKEETISAELEFKHNAWSSGL